MYTSCFSPRSRREHSKRVLHPSSSTFKKFENSSKMRDPHLYHSSNALQVHGTQKALKQKANKITFKDNDRIVDIGCGDGSTMMTILKPLITSKYKELVGVDKKQVMIDFASKKYKQDKVSFALLDITGSIPSDLKQSFDHAFSFYAMNWIKDQKASLTGVYNLLKPGGDCLLVFLSHMPVYDVFRKLAKQDKWNHYTVEVEEFISPYHDSKNPISEVKNLMEKTGFKNVSVDLLEINYKFNCLDYLKRSVDAVNPLNIPDQKRDEFYSDYLDIVREMGLVKNCCGCVEILAEYDLVVAYGVRK